MRRAVVTIASSNYLPQVHAASKSFHRHNQDSDFILVSVDSETETLRVARQLPHVDRVISIDNIGIASVRLAIMKSIYDVTEFSTSIKADVLCYLLRDYDVVIFVDPDVWFTDSISDAAKATEEHGWTLTPHRLSPIPKGREEAYASFLQAGAYNLGYVGVTREATDMLQWWAERLTTDAVSEARQFLFTDQKWIDLAASMWSPHVISDPGLNVAYWNLDERDLRYESVFMVQNQPLKMFHFSGFDLKNKFRLSKHAPMGLISNEATQALSRLTLDYRQALFEGIKFHLHDSYPWDKIAPGIVATESLRRSMRDAHLLHRRIGVAEPSFPFSQETGKHFLDWMKSHTQRDELVLPRAVHIALDDRPDVLSCARERASTPAAVEAIVLGWCLQDEFPDLLTRVAAGNSIYARDALSRVPKCTQALRPTSVTLVGHHNRASGVSVATGAIAEALAFADIPFGIRPAEALLPNPSPRAGADATAKPPIDNSLVILAVNADQARAAILNLLRHGENTGPIIGYWHWELQDFPESAAFNGYGFSQILVASSFVRSAVNRLLPSMPTSVIPVHIAIPSHQMAYSNPYLQLGLRARPRHIFLNVFDYLSVYRRKNPEAVVAAYRKAFPKPQDTLLVIKTVNSEKDLTNRERLHSLCFDRPDIIILEDLLDFAEMQGLYSHCDTYVSLHRSEGFGISIASAMASGKSVITTAYSGNMDYTNDCNSVLIDYSLVPVGPDAAPYSSSALWAEPSTDEAAEAMLRLSDGSPLTRALGDRARKTVSKQLSVESVGQRLARSLASLNASASTMSSR